MTSLNRPESNNSLGMNQVQGIDKAYLKKQLTNNLKLRLKCILKTHLSISNKVRTTNIFAIPVKTFGILEWTTTELEDLNRMKRVMHTKSRVYHPNTCKEHFDLLRNLGGRGIADLRTRHQE